MAGRSDKTIQVFTRSSINELYDMAMSFIPEHIEKIRCDQFGKWWEASDYLHHIINEGIEWVVNIDDDCFVTDWGEVENTIEMMAIDGYDYAGMPDGGVCPHRCRSWIVVNPFFTIFNAKEIREKLIPKEKIDICGFLPILERGKPPFVNEHYSHDTAEPFAGFFYWLKSEFEPYYLNATTHSDGISTITLNGTVYHSWYTREFVHDIGHRNRILSLYNEANEKRVHYSPIQG